MSEESPEPFQEYEVPGVGTVIDPQGEPGYRVRLSDGRVTAYPAQSGDPSQANAATDIAYALANPAPMPLTDVQIYEQQQALGYEDATTGLKLKMTDRARSHFTSQVTLVQVALSAGIINTSTPQHLWDFNDAEQTLSTADFLALMLRYGVAWQTMFATYAP